MKREVVLMLLGTLLALGLALIALRFFEPRLFGAAPRDLRITFASETLPPFFRGALRHEAGIEGEDMLVNDPETIVRGQSFYPNLVASGPHDLLGFRNYAVPWRADLVIFGDSQTYGMGVSIDESWPELLKGSLPPEFRGVYSAALGGFSAAQYQVLFDYMLRLRPTHALFVVYTGNDLLETFRAVYALEHFKQLRQGGISLNDFPNTPHSELAEVEVQRFANGFATGFTPARRLHALNKEDRAVAEGLRLTKVIFRDIIKRAEAEGVQTVVTIIPTKEYLFWPRLQNEALATSETFAKLVANESAVIEALRNFFAETETVDYIDLASPLREAIGQGASLYQRSGDGHPAVDGHRLIADILQFHLQKKSVDVADGLYRVKHGRAEIFVVKEGSDLFLVQDSTTIDARQATALEPNQFFRYPLRGVR